MTHATTRSFGGVTYRGYTGVDGSQRFETIPVGGGQLAVATAASAKDWPVLVFLHGGSYVGGDYLDPATDPGACVADGIVVVSVDYRVGEAGFGRYPGEAPYRYRGIDDCFDALEWVQRTIEAFGGDPTSVTLVGQSAGAGIAAWLCRRDHYRGAFRRALLCSPALPRTAARPAGATSRLLLPRLDLPYGPHPFQATELSGVDVIVTTSRNEFYNFFPAATRADKRGYGALVARLLARRLGVRGGVSAYLAASRRIDPNAVLRRLLGDAGVRRWAQDIVDGTPGRRWLGEYVGPGAMHSAELPALFQPGPVHDWLVRLVHTGEPGWPEYWPHSGRITGQLSTVDGLLAPAKEPLKYVRLAFHPGQ
ncbi:carboxylesterase family protein [Corynebacterium uterequi]|uniref:Carboxylic ester hydrolase n=1 Tax=Corynebacterium uterequi TaxID=1072256 RepID=A0A0G3HI48_9CORY|nr:carboxylesterase family protein [Corynebacterium uterequi]AKK11593.1 carboxylesterase type B [Corynebacterium uterequi]